MTTCNRILFHWKKSQKDVEKNLTRLQQQINAAAIHDIRVAIKKLRALLNLYILIKKEPGWEQQLKKTEILFNILGRQRDVAICRSITDSLEKETGGCSKEWKQYLQAIFKQTTAWANQEIHHYHKKELAKIALELKQGYKLTLDEEFYLALTTIINTRLTATKKHLRQTHLVRQRLKEIYYWIALFPEQITLKTWHQKELHSLLDDLGNWQDYAVLQQRLKHFRKDYLPKSFEEYKLLAAFEKKIDNNKIVLLKNANGKVRRWLKKVVPPENKKSEV